MPLIVALLLAAGSDRCASTELCPTDRDIVSAIQQYEADIYFASQAEVEKQNPGSILLMTPQTFRRIADVYCASPLNDVPKVIRCKFTAIRGLKTEYYVTGMTQTEDGWRLIDPSIVTRSSPPPR